MSLFNVYPLYNVTPVSAKDVYVYDDQGVKYLDLYGGHAVISIGHSHPKYVSAISNQVNKLGFYSNAIQNPLQSELADKLAVQSGCKDYQLFMCSSGAEANENALKLASFHNGKHKILAFKNSFHGRTSAAVAATDNPKVVAPLNAQQEVDFADLGDLECCRKDIKRRQNLRYYHRMYSRCWWIRSKHNRILPRSRNPLQTIQYRINCRRSTIWIWKNRRFFRFSKTQHYARYYFNC